MGCMVCNPFCGRCRPPQPKPMKCDSCGKLALRTRYETWECNHCGAPLPPRPKIKCNWSGRMCDVPCMYNAMDNPTGELHPCRWPPVAKRSAT